MSIEIGSLGGCDSLDSITGDFWDDSNSSFPDKLSACGYKRNWEKKIFSYPDQLSFFQFLKSVRVQRAHISQADAKVERISHSRNVKQLPKGVEAKVELEWTWGGEEGSKFQAKGSGSVSDDNGNSAEVSIKHDSDGETTVAISVETKSE